MIKVQFKTNNSFNSTMSMMASFLPVIVSKKNRQTEKNIGLCLLLQCITNSHRGLHSLIDLNPEKQDYIIPGAPAPN